MEVAGWRPTSGQFLGGSMLGDRWGSARKVGPGCVLGKLTVRVFLLKIDRPCEWLFLRPAVF